MTDRLTLALTAYDKAKEAHRISTKGERDKTSLALAKAATEVLAAENEVRRLEKAKEAA